MNNQIFDIVSRHLADELCVSQDSIKPEMRLVEDLHADSATLIMLVMDLEDEFNTTVSDDRLSEIKTVGDVVSLIEAEQA